MPARIAVIFICGLLIAACGSSSEPSQRASAGYSQGLAFARCMRSHGVPDFPDPSTVAGSRINNIGGNPESPASQAAQRSCRHLMPSATPLFGVPTADAMAQALKVSRCMRAHGIPGFPDPPRSPGSSVTGNSTFVNEHGAVQVIPSSIDIQSPAFRQAAAACNLGPRP